MNKELKTAEETLDKISKEEGWHDGVDAVCFNGDLDTVYKAMESYAEQFKLPPITKEQAEKIWEEITGNFGGLYFTKEVFIELLTSIK